MFDGIDNIFLLLPAVAGTLELRRYKRNQGRPRKNWMNIVTRDLKDLGTSWDEAEELATSRAEWCQCVAQYIHLDVG